MKTLLCLSIALSQLGPCTKLTERFAGADAGNVPTAKAEPPTSTSHATSALEPTQRTAASASAASTGSPARITAAQVPAKKESGSDPGPRHGLANGLACTFDSDCASASCSFNVCRSKSSGAKQLGNGVACTFSSDCASGDCSFNVCRSKSGDKELGNGVKCTFDSECASHSCSFGECR